MAPLVADIVADALVAAGVAHLLTTSPPAAAPFADAARARGLCFVESRSAATIAVMAAVTGELTDTPGVLVLSAADAANAIAGIRYATSAGAPLLLISDNAPSAEAAPHVTVVRVTHTAASADIAHALSLTLQHPRRPLHVVLTPAIAGAAARRAWSNEGRGNIGAAPAPDPSMLDRAAGVLGDADRPVLIIGRRCRLGNAAPWLRALAEAVPMPVLTTPRGRGVLPDPHPLMLGLLGDGEALLARADLVVAAGVDAPEESVAWSLALPRLELGALTDDTVPPPGVVRVRGDVALIVEELAPRLRDRPRADWDVAELDRDKRASRAAARSPEVSLVRELTPPGTIATVDDGPIAAVVAAGWQIVGPNELLIGAGAPGQPFAPAGAVAATLARPGAHAVAFVEAAALDSAEDAMEIAGRLRAPVTLVGVGGSSGLRGDELARAVHRALAAGGPHVVATPGRSRQGSPV
jgi:acetolactate synthase I/II/III large subunit